jgi:hypothetical protein
MTPVDRITSLDTSLFSIEVQNVEGDRSTLLRLQNIARRKPYVYLELGSHVGGTLVPHLLDPMCKIIYSVDKRPADQPDERGIRFAYPENTTARMVSTLRTAVSDLGKLRTYDMGSAELTPDLIQEPPDLIFVDAEHTNRAAFGDFLNLRKLAAPNCIIAFHDSNLIFDALLNVESLLGHEETRHTCLFLPATVFVVLLGELCDNQDLHPLAYDKETFIIKARLDLDAQRASLAIRRRS